MLVASRFDGDDDEGLQWAQHDAYGRALDVILREARQRLSDAEALLGASSELSMAVLAGQFDHHVLQDAHDLLAAQWRAANGLVHPRLPGTEQPEADLIAHWLNWLGDWVRQCEPALARAILQVAYSEPPPDHAHERMLLERLELELNDAVGQSRPSE